MKGQVFPSVNAQVIRFPTTEGARREVCSTRHGGITADKDRPKPAWRVLYIAVALTILLFVVAEVETPAGGWRILMECLGTVLIIGVMALWVRVNRTPLALAEASRYEERGEQSPVARPDSFAIEFRQTSRTQTRSAEEDSRCFAK